MKNADALFLGVPLTGCPGCTSGFGLLTGGLCSACGPLPPLLFQQSSPGCGWRDGHCTSQDVKTLLCRDKLAPLGVTAARLHTGICCLRHGEHFFLNPHPETLVCTDQLAGCIKCTVVAYWITPAQVEVVQVVWCGEISNCQLNEWNDTRAGVGKTVLHLWGAETNQLGSKPST